ncbi:hypothetical protein Tco_1308094 [Tanacetum coccineum]
MLPNFFQIVNQLYAFIYETKHSKSGLGLPSIVALVMTIDKSWTTISNRNSDAFLDGLFEFIAHYVAESDQDVIHGSNSSDVALSVGLTVLESTDLSINAQSTEVDAPPVNEDNANANEDNADVINNEDDVIAHVLDDDDFEVSDDDEVNPSTNVEEVLSSNDSDYEN